MCRAYETGPFKRHVTNVVWRAAAHSDTFLEQLPESLLAEVVACLTGCFSEESLERAPGDETK